MTFLARQGLLTSETTASAPAHIPIYHNQLRDLLVCPQERGIVAYVSGKVVVSHDIRGSYRSPRLLAHLDFEPNCLSSGAGLIAAGGGNGELFIGSFADSSVNSSFLSPQIQWSHTTKLSSASINNSLLLTRNDLTPSGPLPDPTTGNPRLFVSNNDKSIKAFNLSVSGSTQGRMIPAGSIRVGTPVNHTSISPDGKTLLAVGDTNEVFLYNLTAGESIEFQKIAKYSAGLDANFSTAWSSDGRKFAVACQDGCVTAWDTRSSKTLALFRCGRQHPDYHTLSGGGRQHPDYHTLSGGGRGHFTDAYYPARTIAMSTYATRLATRLTSGSTGAVPPTPGSIVSRYLSERSPGSPTYNDVFIRTESDRRGSPNLGGIAARNRYRWEGSERQAPAAFADSNDRRHGGDYLAPMQNLENRDRVPSSRIADADALQEGRIASASGSLTNTSLPYYPSSQFYPSFSDGDSLPLPPREIIVSWPDRHRTTFTPGDSGRQSRSWTDQRTGGWSAAPGVGSEERNPARVLRFSPGNGNEEVLVFIEDSTRFHVIDAQSFDEHLVVTVPRSSSETNAPSSSRRTVGIDRDRLTRIQRDDSDEEMDDDAMVRPVSHLPVTSSWPSRGTALTAFSDGTPNLAGLAFDPSGRWVYVGTDTGVFEWELGRDSRKWDRGYVSWA